MRALSLLPVLLTLALTGCSGDSGGGGSTPPELTSANYTVTDVDEDTDACGVGASASTNDLVSVLVDGNSIQIGPSIDGTIDGNDIDASDPSPLEQSFDNGNDSCTAITRNDFSGTITDDNVFELEDEYRVTVSGNDFPQCPFDACISRFSYTLDAN